MKNLSIFFLPLHHARNIDERPSHMFNLPSDITLGRLRSDSHRASDTGDYQPGISANPFLFIGIQRSGKITEGQ